MTEKTIATILSHYDIGRLISTHTFSTGTVQENIQIHTDQGTYVLKHYKTRSVDYVACELSLIDYLHQKGYCCPLVYKTKGGKHFELYNKKVVAIFEYVEGEHLSKLTYDQLDQLIQKVAELHLITADLQLEGSTYRWNYGLEFCQWYIREKLADRKDDVHQQKKEWLIKELDTLQLPQELSQGIIHGDLDPSNIICKNQDIKAIIDFDDANDTYLIFDIIGLIDRRNYTYLSHKYFELIRYIIEKYEKVRKLTDADRMYFFDVLKLSILIDCLWFFDRGDFSRFKEKEKIDQLNKMGRETFSKKIQMKHRA